MSQVIDLAEIKSVLEIPAQNHGEDKKILFLIEYVSNLMEEVLNRPGLFQASRTEYYDGTGTVNLLLKSRPVLATPAIQCWVDAGGYWGQVSGGGFNDSNVTPLTYGVDYVLKIDSDVDGKSLSGILVKIKGIWEKRFQRAAGYLSPFVPQQEFGNIKVIYTGGHTVNDLPPVFRFAAVTTIAKLRQMLPLGFFLSSESYEERSVGYLMPWRNNLMADLWTWLSSQRNYRW